MAAADVADALGLIGADMDDAGADDGAAVDAAEQPAVMTRAADRARSRFIGDLSLLGGSLPMTTARVALLDAAATTSTGIDPDRMPTASRDPDVFFALAASVPASAAVVRSELP